MGHPNEDEIRKGYAAFASGDLETIRGQLADEVVWHVGGRSPLAGDYRGKDEVLGFFAKLVEMTAGTFRVDVHDVLANDEHGVALVKSHAERNGKSLDSNFVQVFHLKDGKTVEAWGHSDDQYAVDELFS